MTVVHRATPEIEARFGAAHGRGAFRLGIGEVVDLGAESKGFGIALRLLDVEGGLERVCDALKVPMSTLPHITLLHPSNSTGREAQLIARQAATRLLLPRDFVVDDVTLIEERADVWHELERIALGSR